MDINERMFSTMKEKKITQEQLANALNTSQSVVAGWKNRGTIPSIEHLPIICKILGVSWEYLVTGEETKVYYTDDEKYIISLFRRTNKKGQKRVIETAEEMYKLYSDEEYVKDFSSIGNKTKEIKYIPYPNEDDEDDEIANSKTS